MPSFSWAEDQLAQATPAQLARWFKKVLSADTLEELWLSYNQIDKLKGIESMKKLKVFYISFNNIRDWGEFTKLQNVKTLEDLLMFGNPIYDSMEEKAYRKETLRILPFLKKLDGEPVTSNVIVD